MKHLTWFDPRNFEKVKSSQELSDRVLDKVVFLINTKKSLIYRELCHYANLQLKNCGYYCDIVQPRQSKEQKEISEDDIDEGQNQSQSRFWRSRNRKHDVGSAMCCLKKVQEMHSLCTGVVISAELLWINVQYSVWRL